MPAPVITLLETIPGVELASSHQPVALVITPSVGKNELSIQWSKASSDTAKNLVAIQYEASPIDASGHYSVNWGDGSTTEKYPLGWTIDTEHQHSYTSGGLKTITIIIHYKRIDIEEEVTLGVTPSLSSNLILDQIQIEKYQDNVLIYEPDWLPISRLATTFVDDRVNKKHSYKYRYRLRRSDRSGQPKFTSLFSSVTEQPAWS